MPWGAGDAGPPMQGKTEPGMMTPDGRLMAFPNTGFRPL